MVTDIIFQVMTEVEATLGRVLLTVWTLVIIGGKCLEVSQELLTEAHKSGNLESCQDHLEETVIDAFDVGILAI